MPNHLKISYKFETHHSLQSSDGIKSDHKVIYAKSKRNDNEINFKTEILDLRLSNITNYVTDLSKINWTDLYKNYNLNGDQRCDLFYQKISTAMGCIPVQKITVNENQKEWITPVCMAIAEKAHEKNTKQLVKRTF